MNGTLDEELGVKLEELAEGGLYKKERLLLSSQGARVKVEYESEHQELLNFCSNNYLGLAGDARMRAAAMHGIEKWGYGMASVRFICGYEEPHRQLESRMAEFLGMEDAILFSSCFDANGSLFEALLDENCAIITDSLNHASIIDGIRLCKAKKWIYRHNDMSDKEAVDPETGRTAKGLELCLRESASCRMRLIATDGVFSMDGDVAMLREICDLAEKYNSLVMVDDSHATGFMGRRGRGTHEECDVMDRVDILSTTFGKALGGASGGCIASSKRVVEWLRQKGRPYLFSNSLAPAIVEGTLCALDILEESSSLRDQLMTNTAQMRKGLRDLGFDLREGRHPICPVMIYDEHKAADMALRLRAEGVYVIGFSFPVVPRGKARIRVQVSAAHSAQDIRVALAAFEKVGREMGLLSGS